MVWILDWTTWGSLTKHTRAKRPAHWFQRLLKTCWKKRTQLSTHCQVYSYMNIAALWQPFKWQTLLSVMDLWRCCLSRCWISAQTFVSLSFLSNRKFISNCKVQNVECPHWSTQTYLVSCESNICVIRTDWIRNNGYALLRFFHIDSSSLMSAGHQRRIRRHKTWQAKSIQRRHLTKHIQCFNKLKECLRKRHGMAEHTTFKAMDVAQVWVFIGSSATFVPFRIVTPGRRRQCLPIDRGIGGRKLRS